MKPMTYKELGEKVAEQALDDYLINGKTMREWINILSDNMSVLEQIRDEIDELDRYYDNDYFSTNNCPMYKCNEVLQIIDRYKKGE